MLSINYSYICNFFAIANLSLIDIIIIKSWSFLTEGVKNA
ncbi:Uncharacterized protein dnm_048690 [Desulfonema magnum]|uniref:Uncharacterized protein n=1 Tax=Desulfonema magnum TaxID=45655 RepID=A0A975BNJ9_9BACT|nr:Uncharacterized protein dnm_048690 [Desulfonema magnum]